MVVIRPRTHRHAIIVILLASTSLATPDAGAQTVYQWRDDKGVVNFSQSGFPPDAQPSERVFGRAGDTQSGPAGSGGERRQSAGTSPANITVATAENFRLAPTQRTFTGTVENTGQTPAANVTVTLIILDQPRGEECGHSDLAVVPSTLDPGAIGTFTQAVDNACLRGTPSIELLPHWR